jgi:hypothetical protein
MPSGSGKRGLIGGAVVSLVITLLLSLGAVYGLNRYLGPVVVLWAMIKFGDLYGNC